jgi:hypothetical protein
MGISYAAWNNGLEMDASVSTGNMNYKITVNEVPYDSDDIVDNEITPTIFMNEGEIKDIEYTLVNKGTIPMKIEAITINGDTEASVHILDERSNRYSSVFSVENVDESTEEIPFQIRLSLSQHTD